MGNLGFSGTYSDCLQLCAVAGARAGWEGGNRAQAMGRRGAGRRATATAAGAAQGPNAK